MGNVLGRVTLEINLSAEIGCLRSQMFGVLGGDLIVERISKVQEVRRRYFSKDLSRVVVDFFLILKVELK